MTDDLSSIYPALAARQVGWEDVPMLCVREIDIDGTLPLIIRVLLHWNTNLPQSAIHHIYLDRAVALRPDLAQISQPGSWPDYPICWTIFIARFN